MKLIPFLAVFLVACDDANDRVEIEQQRRINAALLDRLERGEEQCYDTPIPRPPPARGMADFAEEWAEQDRMESAAIATERAAIERERQHGEAMEELQRLRYRLEE